MMRRSAFWCFPCVFFVYLVEGSLMSLAGLQGNENLLAIPRVSEKLAEKLAKCDAYSDKDWENAAIVHKFTGPGFKGGIPAWTVARLYHDGKGLYAAFLCNDEDIRDNLFERKYGECLTQDECVVVTIGLTGDADTQAVYFGGYEGAQGGKISNAETYYEFILTAAGAKARYYNETILPDPGFKSKVILKKKGWIALMVIPFAKVGLENAEDTKLFFNLFRYHRAKRWGLYHPNLSAYSPYPFQEVYFLKASENANRSIVESVDPVKVREEYVPPVHPIEMEYYPLEQKVSAKFPSSASAREACLMIEGTDLKKTIKLSKIRSSYIHLALPKNFSKKTLRAVATITGEPQKTKTGTYTYYQGEPPEWFGTKIAMEYVKDNVPYPWKEIAFDGVTAKLVHAELTFGDTALPVGIKVLGREVVRGPATVDAQMKDGKTLPVVTKKAEHELSPGRLVFDPKDEIGVQVRSMMEFDGFLVVRLRLNGYKATDLARLVVKIPLGKGIARYINRAHSQDNLAIYGNGYRDNAREFWVGSVDAGLAFSYDRRCFFSTQDGRQIEVKMNEDDTSDLVLRLVNKAGQVYDDEQVFQFFLTMTPVRPDHIPPVCKRLDLWHELWSDHQGYPQLSKIPVLKKRADKAHKEGKLFFAYFSMLQAETSPGFKEFRPDWVALPERMWYQRATDPGKGVKCYVTCLREGVGDLLLEGFAKLADGAGMDGVYFDGPACPFSCENIGHNCSDSLPARWGDDFGEGRILKHRIFMKRTRGIFDSRGKTLCIWNHQGGGFSSFATISLQDIWYDGEHLVRYPVGHIIDPETFLIAYSGKAFGWRSLLVAPLFVNAAGGSRTTGALGLIHDTENYWHGMPAFQSTFFDFVRFRDTNAKFYGYWKEQPHITMKGDLPVSYYRGEKEAMLATSNIQYAGAKTITIDLRKMFDGAATDVMYYDNGYERVERNQISITTTVEENSYRVFRAAQSGVIKGPPPPPAPEGPVVTNFKPITSFNKKDWVISGNNQDVEKEVVEKFKLPLLRKSVPATNEMNIFLKERLPRDFTAKFRVATNVLLNMKLDDMTIQYNAAGDGWNISGLNLKDYVGDVVARPRCTTQKNPPFQPNEIGELTVIFKDGRLSVLYNGRFVVDRVLAKKQYNSHALGFTSWAWFWLGLDVIYITEGGVHHERPRLHPAP